MAEKQWKLRICRIFRSCKSKDCISTYDVLDTHSAAAHHLEHYLIEQQQQHFNSISIFSPINNNLLPPPPSPYTNTFFINTNPTYFHHPEGQKCPPVSPIISPLNIDAALYNLRRNETPKIKSNKATKTYMSTCTRYNNFDPEEEKQQKTALVSGRRLGRSSSMSRETRRRSAVEDEMKSLAVVKRSSDPYADFRASMVEMIIQNQMFAAKDLRELLKCFLSLNSSHYHTLILQVFDEISQSLLHYHHPVGQRRK